MRYLTLALLVLLFLPVVSSEVFQRNQNITITQSVVRDGFIDSSLIVNITVENPSNVVLVGNMPMIFNSTSNRFQYFLSSGNTSVPGEYTKTITATNGTLSSTEVSHFTVTQTGREFSSGQGLVGISILIGALGLSIIFLVLGFKFWEDVKPLALFFVVIAIFLGLYSLQLGLNYSVDILEYDSLAGLQSRMYMMVLWLVAGIGIISMILMTFGFVREFGKGKMMKNYGEGFDPISQTYQ